MKTELKKNSSPSQEPIEKVQIDKQPCEDERYPGSFFKVPGTPRPGRTTWRIS